MNEKKLIDIQGRVSTSEQEIETQLMVIRDHCKKNDFEINEEHCDIGVSGSKGSRPGLDNMMAQEYRQS